MSILQTPLAERLADRIETTGPMTIEAFMAACLSDPEHGYYARAEAIGAAGDFVTAPEMGQVFGELLGVWARLVWQAMGAPRSARLIELGPGRGTLMADCLRAASVFPPFAAALSAHLVEISAALTDAQRRRLAGILAPIHWHRRLEDVPPGAGILIGNEFLDCLPVRQLIKGALGWGERLVTLNDDRRLSFAVGPAREEIASAVPVALRAAVPGSVFELRPGLEGLLRTIAGRAAGAPTAALFIDYGHPSSALGDTLQAVRDHRYIDVLEAPGAADLTAHVDFEALAASAASDGLAVDGPVPQAAFLGRLGLNERTAALLRTASTRQRLLLESAAARLTNPLGMGGRFLAIGIRSPGLPSLPGFA